MYTYTVLFILFLSWLITFNHHDLMQRYSLAWFTVFLFGGFIKKERRRSFPRLPLYITRVKVQLLHIKERQVPQALHLGHRHHRGSDQYQPVDRQVLP